MKKEILNLQTLVSEDEIDSVEGARNSKVSIGWCGNNSNISLFGC